MKQTFTYPEDDANLRAFLKDTRPLHATLHYDDHTEDVRLALSTSGSLVRMAPRSRTRGFRINTHGLVSVSARKQTPKTPGQTYTDNLKRYRNYILRNIHPNLWAKLQKELENVTDERLAEFVEAAEDCQDYFEAWKLAGELGLPQIERHKTLTLKACKAPQYVMEGVREAIETQEDFLYSWRSNYDYRVSGSLGADGTFWATLSQEYKGCGNGHYWLLISPTQAIFCEDD